MSIVSRSRFVVPCFVFLTDISSAALPRLVKDIAPGGGDNTSAPRDFCAVGEILYFTANDRVHGRELWRSDGTEGGTVMVKDILPGAGGEFEEEQPARLTAVGNTLYFTVDDGVHGREMWKSDGTATGTVMVKDILPNRAPSNPDRLTVLNGVLHFRAVNSKGRESLWRTDGTAEGTVEIADINVSYSGGSVPDPMTVMNGNFYFTADDGIHGEELWKSDGTPAGTAMLKDIYTGAPNPAIYPPYYLTALGNTLYFTANDGVAGEELWKTDGTPDGTVLVKNIYTGPLDIYPHSLAASGNTLYFIADDGTTGWELWRSDGTEDGTRLVKNINQGQDTAYPLLLTDAGGTLFFVAGDEEHGQELWRSDGTDNGTFMVKDTKPGPDSGMGDLAIMKAVGSKLFFVPNDGELWTSDGTPEGTVLIGERAPEGDAPSPESLTVINGKLFYSAFTPALGRELFVYDIPSASSDSDGDGQSDAAELLTGFDPANPRDFLRMECLRPSQGTVTLRLNKVRPGVSYRLETSTDLSGWTPLGTKTFPAEGPGDIADPRPVPPQASFYRVVASPAEE